jgi:TRAP-type C4-dicarboxylate transport system permease small subunit
MILPVYAAVGALRSVGLEVALEKLGKHRAARRFCSKPSFTRVNPQHRYSNHRYYIEMTKRVPEELLAITSMAALVAITLLNVVTRYLTDDSFGWTEEISVCLMVILTLSGASAVAGRDSHIRIEFLLNRRMPDGSEEPRRGLLIFSSALSSAVFLLLAALFARWVWDQYRYNETSTGLGLPLWWYGVAVPPLFLAASARAFAGLLKRLRSTPASTPAP